MLGRSFAAIALRAFLIAVPVLSAATLAQGQDAQAEIIERAVPTFPHAKVYSAQGTVTRPIVIILAGAEGGDEAGRRFGPIFARLGYAAVSLPYYSPNWGQFAPPPQYPELPGSFVDIRVDQLADLRKILATIAGLDVKRIALFGGSKGSEFALIAASRYDWITSVVAYTPSDVVWEGWGMETVEHEGTRSSFSFEGKALPFMPYKGFSEGLLAGDKADLRAIHENGRAGHPDREAIAAIPVERFKGPILVIAGDQDKLWNSGQMARNIAHRRKTAGQPTELLVYPDAGHDLAGGSTQLRVDARGGGSAAANAKARGDAWPQVIAFLARTLRP
jgi:uncharacterized protein